MNKWIKIHRYINRKINQHINNYIYIIHKFLHIHAHHFSDPLSCCLFCTIPAFFRLHVFQPQDAIIPNHPTYARKLKVYRILLVVTGILAGGTPQYCRCMKIGKHEKLYRLKGWPFPMFGTDFTMIFMKEKQPPSFFSKICHHFVPKDFSLVKHHFPPQKKTIQLYPKIHQDKGINLGTSSRLGWTYGALGGPMVPPPKAGPPPVIRG